MRVLRILFYMRMGGESPANVCRRHVRARARHAASPLSLCPANADLRMAPCVVQEGGSNRHAELRKEESEPRKGGARVHTHADSLARLHVISLRLCVERNCRSRTILYWSFVLASHAILESFDCFPKICASIGKLLSPEDQHHNDQDDCPVPNTKRTHCFLQKIG